MAKRSEAIARFLHAKTHPDLASLYNPSMEVQVNVAQDGGERVEGNYKGKNWQAWTDGIQQWKSFRMPLSANTEPVLNDEEIRYDLVAHAEAIGMTGWDFVAKVSRWVAYDFDAITGHSDRHTKKLTDEELTTLRETVASIPWVTVRHSTGGRGLHLYVHLFPIPTANHNEHAALARAILGKLSAITGFDFASKVDVCGGNMWIWHRKMIGTDGLKIIKSGEILTEAPENWRDHLTVVSGRRRKTVPSFIAESDADDIEKLFDELSGQRSSVTLDEDHKKLIKWLEESNAKWSWDQDSRILTCHTYDLKLAHEALGLRGVFETTSKGTERGGDWNAFCYPMRRGGWSVRRFTPGVAEANSWFQDSSGWTMCYYNTDPDLRTLSRANEGIENPNRGGGFVFREGEVAQKVAKDLGVDLALPPWAMGRQTVLKEHKDGRLLVEMERKDTDSAEHLSGWLPDKKLWKKLFNVKAAPPKETEHGNYDDSVRHLVTEGGKEVGWVLKIDGGWQEKEKGNVATYLAGALDLEPKEVTKVLGATIARPWTIVNQPFKAELVGDRKWNRNAAGFRFVPNPNTENLSYPTFQKILDHAGRGLDVAVGQHSWCKANGILSGADYLKLWVASMFQEPYSPLPYLFFYSEAQATGKSTFHQAIAMLMTKGVARADNALTNQQGFNGELEGAVLAVIEETSMRRNKMAYNRIKDWVTSPTIQIHPKNGTPYDSHNTLHFVHCTNDRNDCPAFAGDTRVVVCEVPQLEPMDMMTQKKMFPLLEKEAPDFLAELLSIELPVSPDRLNLPIVITPEKIALEVANLSYIEQFIREEAFRVDGATIKYRELYDRFQTWLPMDEREAWTINRMGKGLPSAHPKGRLANAEWHVANLAWEPREPEQPIQPELILRGERLVPKDGK